MPAISPSELSVRLESTQRDVFVLDIRPREDFEEWHIPGSENIDIYEDLKEETEVAQAALSELPEAPEIVTVCAAGVISQKATKQLRDLGYDAKTLEDGMYGWSRVHRTGPVDVEIPGTLIQVARPGKGCLSHVLVSDGEAAVFDPSQYSDEYEDVLATYDAELVSVYDTHAHADHISGGRKLADRYDVRYHRHPADAEHIDAAPVRDGERFSVGDVIVEVIHTPGHSPGSVTYAIGEAALLTGDTLFHESVGRVELGVKAGLEETDVTENAERLYESLQRLLAWDDDSLVQPAHDPGSPDPPVTARLREVRERNADLQRSRADFVGTLSSDISDHPPNFERVKRVNVGTADVPAEELAELELGPNRCAAE